MHPSNNPFDLPELGAILAPFLFTRTIAACVLVSKSWHSTFQPFLYSDLRLFGPHWDRLNPNLKLLRQYPASVKSLYLCAWTGPALLSQASFTNNAFLGLKKLRIGITTTSVDVADQMKHCRDMLSTGQSIFGPTLSNLHLNLKGHHFGQDCWESLSPQAYPALRSFKLTMTDASEPAFVRVWEALESLSLEYVRFHSMTKSLESIPRFWSMQKVRLNHSNFKGSNVLVFLVRCPNLKELYCEFIPGESFTNGEVLRHIVGGCWPMLEGIQLSNVFDNEIPGMLQALRGPTLPGTAALGPPGGLKKLLLSRANFGEKSFAMLMEQKHYETLEELDLCRCKLVTSRMVQGIMRIAPCLKEFKAGRMDSKDILFANPDQIHGHDQEHGQDTATEHWACTRLQLLTIEICLDSRDHQRPVFERLAQLSHLRHLGVHGCKEDDAKELERRKESHLRFEIGTGLETLTSLTRVESIVFMSPIEPRLEVAQWMVQQWKELRTLRGYAEQDVGIREWLQSKEVSSF